MSDAVKGGERFVNETVIERFVRPTSKYRPEDTAAAYHNHSASH